MTICKTKENYISFRVTRRQEKTRAQFMKRRGQILVFLTRDIG